jgi:hypothetical protein
MPDNPPVTASAVPNIQPGTLSGWQTWTACSQTRNGETPSPTASPGQKTRRGTTSPLAVISVTVKRVVSRMLW